MISNPYETNDVLRHVIDGEPDGEWRTEDPGGGWHTKCGLIAHARLQFEGFEPRPCQDCHETHTVAWS